MRASSSSNQNGLATKSVAPSSKLVSRSGRPVRAVSTMTGAVDLERNCSSTASPSRSGSDKSSKRRSNAVTLKASKACAPVVASSGTKPVRLRP